MNKIKCECGMGCDYEPSTYERINKLACNNSRMNKHREVERKWELELAGLTKEELKMFI